MLSSAQGFSPRPRIPTSFLFARHLPNAKSFLRLQPKKPTHRCKESLTSNLSRRNNQQETDAPSILPERAGVATMPSARIGRKTTKFSIFYPRLTYSEISGVSGLASSIVTMTNLLPNLLPLATNTSIFGVTEPNPTPTHAPNLEECGRYTLYARNSNRHCIGLPN
jgi:hypothetical protein